MGKVLGIDFGTKRVGLATGEADFCIAFPRGVIVNTGVDKLVGEIVQTCNELDIAQIVVGLPLSVEFQNRENRVMADVESFVERLREESDLDVVLFDERFSSFEADELMNEATGRGDKKILGRDAYAAQVILQRFFDTSKT